MQDRTYHIKISPEVLKNDIFGVVYAQDEYSRQLPFDICCAVSGETVTGITTGITYVYSSMTQILSGGTNGDSILTDLSIPIFLSENTVDIGYYSVFDGAITQKETMLNFLFTADTSNPYEINFFNTSDKEFKRYLEFSEYYLDWGDGGRIQTVDKTTPNSYRHTYSSNGTYTISMSGLSPWGYNLIKKEVTVPFTDITIDDPYGTAYFISASGSWSGTPIEYNYIFSGDSNCESSINCCQFTTTPFIITGYTQSTLNDLSQYGPKGDPSKLGGKFKTNVYVTGSSGAQGIVYSPTPGSIYTAYTVNNIDYYDYFDGTTVFAVETSGYTDFYCSAITKNEVLLNAVFDSEVQTNIFIERGKNSALERIQRFGEIDNMGDLINYGYGFYNIIQT
jgi:hypothetical protein